MSIPLKGSRAYKGAGCMFLQGWISYHATAPGPLAMPCEYRCKEEGWMNSSMANTVNGKSCFGNRALVKALFEAPKCL